MEEFKAKRHAVKKMTRKGLVETDSREGIVTVSYTHLDVYKRQGISWEN